jgi:hypothetical protein
MNTKRKNAKKGGEEHIPYNTLCPELELFQTLKKYYEKNIKDLHKYVFSHEFLDTPLNGKSKLDDLNAYVSTINRDYITNDSFLKLRATCKSYDLKRQIEKFMDDYNRSVNEIRLKLLKTIEKDPLKRPLFEYTTYPTPSISYDTNGGSNKIYTGPKNGKYIIVVKNGKRIKKYISK